MCNNETLSLSLHIMHNITCTLKINGDKNKILIYSYRITRRKISTDLTKRVNKEKLFFYFGYKISILSSILFQVENKHYSGWLGFKLQIVSQLTCRVEKKSIFRAN